MLLCSDPLKHQCLSNRGLCNWLSQILVSSWCAVLQSVAEICSMCSESNLECKGGIYKATGAPTEVALKVLVEKLGTPNASTNETIRRGRVNDPDNFAEGVGNHYTSRLGNLGTSSKILTYVKLLRLLKLGWSLRCCPQAITAPCLREVHLPISHH